MLLVVISLFWTIKIFHHLSVVLPRCHSKYSKDPLSLLFYDATTTITTIGFIKTCSEALEVDYCRQKDIFEEESIRAGSSDD